MEGLQSCGQRRNLLAYGVEDSGVLVALRDFALERRLLRREGCDFVLQRLVLHRVELREYGVGVGSCAVTERERVVVRSVYEGVCLLAGCEAAFVTLTFDRLEHVAAAGRELVEHAVVAALYGVDDLRACQSYAVLDVAKRALDLLARTVERGCDLVDCARVALDCLHEEFTACVACKLGRKSVTSASAETAEASVVPPENACHDGKVNHTPDAVLTAEASVAVHQGEHAGVNASAHESGQHGVDVVACATAASVAEYISLFHKV